MLAINSLGSALHWAVTQRKTSRSLQQLHGCGQHFQATVIRLLGTANTDRKAWTRPPTFDADAAGLSVTDACRILQECRRRATASRHAPHLTDSGCRFFSVCSCVFSLFMEVSSLAFCEGTADSVWSCNMPCPGSVNDRLVEPALQQQPRGCCI